MISDDLDEDADHFDDESEFENSVADPAPKRRDRAETSVTLPDWPATAAREVGLNLDPKTIAWFRSSYVDWRQQAALVLRGWVAANSVVPETTTSIDPADSQLPAEGL